MSSPETDLHRPVPLHDISDDTYRVEITTTDEECSALARRLGDLSISHLSGFFDLMLPVDKDEKTIDSIEVSGSISADVTQRCVVTSDPVETSIEARFSGIISASPADNPDEPSNDEASSSYEEDAPEILGLIVDETIDLGCILADQLALELDPFPRKPNVSFNGYQSGGGPDDKDVKPNPFAVLTKLKDNTD